MNFKIQNKNRKMDFKNEYPNPKSENISAMETKKRIGEQHYENKNRKMSFKKMNFKNENRNEKRNPN